MPATLRSSTLSFALKTLACVAASAALFSVSGHAAELGKLTILSALGQPLQAEIELQGVSANDANTLVARLASAEAHRLAHIALTPTLSALQFQVVENAGRRFIRIMTTQAVTEPFIDLLLELSSSRGVQMREYTLLLDPVELKQIQPAQVAAPQWKRLEVPTPMAPVVVVPQIVTAPTPPVVVANKPVLPAAPAAAAPATPAAYPVKKGDTLGRIAAELKPADVSLDLMLMALYRANPEAFSAKNMNNLLSGKVLAVPEAALVRRGDPADAKSMVLAQAADFSAYRHKLAGQVALSAPAKEAQAKQSAAGKISAKVVEPATAANASPDKLKLSKANSAKAADKSSVAGAEDKIASAEQDAQAAARVKELEKNVSDIEKLMALKNTVIASSPPSSATPPSATGLIDWVMQHLRTLGLVLAAVLALALWLTRRLNKPALTPPPLVEPVLPDPAPFTPSSPLEDHAKLAALLAPPPEAESEQRDAVPASFLAPVVAAELDLANVPKPIVLAPVPVAALAKTMGQAAAVATGRYVKTKPESLPLAPLAVEPKAELVPAEPVLLQQVETLAPRTEAVPLQRTIVLDASNPSAQFDLSSINLELQPFAVKVTPALPDRALEMDTKLDLAKAYQEIGDQEGARELLDEVIKGGNPEQAAQASVRRTLLA